MLRDPHTGPGGHFYKTFVAFWPNKIPKQFENVDNKKVDIEKVDSKMSKIKKSTLGKCLQ